jgi:uncharacterized protein
LAITPLQPEGRQLIQTYGGGAFTIAGVRHSGSVLVFPAETRPWPVTAFTEITAEMLQPVVDAGAEVEFLIVGAGLAAARLPDPLRDAFRNVGVTVEVMDTGAAARTFNVLMMEDRRLAAALIAVP